MAKYKTPEEIQVEQSVGGPNHLDGNPEVSTVLQVFQPDRGRDLLYQNPKFPFTVYPQTHPQEGETHPLAGQSGSTEVYVSYDDRQDLGTITLNDRLTWEQNNFDELKLSKYIGENNFKTKPTIIKDTLDGPVTLTTESSVHGENSNVNETFYWSIDALPFVVNPETDDIIPIDKYYDKEINPTEYNLATEGKIKFYLSPRLSGRSPLDEKRENIDIFSRRDKRTRDGGRNFFDVMITGNNSTSASRNDGPYDGNGLYIFKLNWGDGTEVEYTDKPKLLESTTLFEHRYKKPGYYSITGVVFQVGGFGTQLRTWERFQTNILLNASVNYDLNFFQYENFASVGGLSKNSALIKSMYNMVGVNPIDFSTDKVDLGNIEKINLFDRLSILDTLSKVDYAKISSPFMEILSPYQTPTDDVDRYLFGCTIATGSIDDSYINNEGKRSTNFNPDANFDDGSCLFDFDVNLNIGGENDSLGNDAVVNFQPSEGTPFDFFLSDFVTLTTLSNPNMIAPTTTNHESYNEVILEIIYGYGYVGQELSPEGAREGDWQQVVLEKFIDENGGVVELENILTEEFQLDDGTSAIKNQYRLTEAIVQNYNITAVFESIDITPPLDVFTFNGDVFPTQGVDFDEVYLTWRTTSIDGQQISNIAGDMERVVIERFDDSDGYTNGTELILADVGNNRAVYSTSDDGNNFVYSFKDSNLDQRDYLYNIYTEDNLGNRSGGVTIFPIRPVTDEIPANFSLFWQGEGNMNENGESVPTGNTNPNSLLFFDIGQENLTFGDRDYPYIQIQLEAVHYNVNATTDSGVTINADSYSDIGFEDGFGVYHFKVTDVDTQASYHFYSENGVRKYVAPNGNQFDFYRHEIKSNENIVVQEIQDPDWTPESGVPPTFITTVTTGNFQLEPNKLYQIHCRVCDSSWDESNPQSSQINWSSWNPIKEVNTYGMGTGLTGEVTLDWYEANDSLAPELGGPRPAGALLQLDIDPSPIFEQLDSNGKMFLGWEIQKKRLPIYDDSGNLIVPETDWVELLWKRSDDEYYNEQHYGDDAENIFPYGQFGSFTSRFNWSQSGDGRENDFHILDEFSEGGVQGNRSLTIAAKYDQYGDLPGALESESVGNFSFYDDGLLPGNFDSSTGLPIPNESNIFYEEANNEGIESPHDFLPGAIYQYRIRRVNYTNTLAESDFVNFDDGIVDINPDNPDQDRDGNERYWIETIGDEIIAVQVPGQMPNLAPPVTINITREGTFSVVQPRDDTPGLYASGGAIDFGGNHPINYKADVAGIVGLSFTFDDPLGIYDDLEFVQWSGFGAPTNNQIINRNNFNASWNAAETFLQAPEWYQGPNYAVNVKGYSSDELLFSAFVWVQYNPDLINYGSVTPTSINYDSNAHTEYEYPNLQAATKQIPSPMYTPAGYGYYNYSIDYEIDNFTLIGGFGFVDFYWSHLIPTELVNNNIFETGSPLNWNFLNASTASTIIKYQIEARYYSSSGLTDWEQIGLINYQYTGEETATYRFDSSQSNYIEDREYQFRIRVKAYLPDTVPFDPFTSSDIVNSVWMDYQNEFSQNNFRTFANISPNINITMRIEYNENPQSGEGGASLTPSVNQTFTLNSDNQSIEIQGSDDNVFEFVNWELGINPSQSPVFVEQTDNPNTTVQINNLYYSELYEDLNIELRANYIFTDAGDSEPELYDVTLNVLVPQTTSGNNVSDATYQFENNQTSDTLTTADPDTVLTVAADGFLVQGYTYNGSTTTPNTINVNNTVITNVSNYANSSPTTINIRPIMSAYDPDDPPGGGTCFLRGTMITMADGSLKPIEQIKVDDLVMSYDEETKQIVSNKVVQTFFHPPSTEHLSYGRYLIINGVMKVTTNHAILADTNGRSQYDWPLADKLSVGDYLYNRDLTKVRIDSIEAVDSIVDTFNFEVENTHTYIAENYIVHNIGGDGPGSGKGRIRDAGDAETGQVTVINVG